MVWYNECIMDLNIINIFLAFETNPTDGDAVNSASYKHFNLWMTASIRMHALVGAYSLIQYGGQLWWDFWSSVLIYNPNYTQVHFWTAHFNYIYERYLQYLQ